MIKFLDSKQGNIKSVRKKLGSYYTPQDLANRIAWESLNAWLSKQLPSDREKNHLLTRLRNIRILDPAVGDGAFLISAAEWLERVRKDSGDERSSEEKRREIVENALYGVDIAIDAVKSCRRRLIEWSVGQKEDSKFDHHLDNKILQGNSLIGSTKSSNGHLKYTSGFDWFENYPEVMARSNPGFDVILGNPPYGNILSDDERKYIEREYPFIVGKTRSGTWNSAAHFIVRSKMLLRREGELAFLIPNSILRVNQFSKIRDYLLEELRLWKIIDEGSPFDDVTLEMVSIFCEAVQPKEDDNIKIESMRPSHKQVNTIHRSLLKTCKVFTIYHDDLYSKILQRAKRNFMIASRGRDIPKSHVKKTPASGHLIPYITSGRSVRRYRIDEKYQVYVDDWFMNDKRLKESFETEFLVATKNLRYPRCIIKPRGIIHGGGIVEIRPRSNDVNVKALGLILNSSLIRYICTRYLTNYSQLTTCLNTGILEDLPIIESKHPEVYELLFDALSAIHLDRSNNEACRIFLERLTNALIYDLYFGSDDLFQERVATLAATFPKNECPSSLCKTLRTKSIIDSISAIQRMPDVQIIERELNVI